MFLLRKWIDQLKGNVCRPCKCTTKSEPKASSPLYEDPFISRNPFNLNQIYQNKKHEKTKLGPSFDQSKPCFFQFQTMAPSTPFLEGRNRMRLLYLRPHEFSVWLFPVWIHPSTRKGYYNLHLLTTNFFPHSSSMARPAFMFTIT